MQSIIAWVETHPALFALVIWPAITALATLLFKPRSAAEYAQLPPRVAAVLRLVGALGLDVPNVLKALRVLFTGKQDPPAPPPPNSPTSTHGVDASQPRPTLRPPALRRWAFAAMVVVALACVGCPPAGAASPQRATVRGAILTIAEAISIADRACADIARERRAPQIARTCADAYDVARPALIAAEAGVDAWDSGQQHQVLCSAVHAVRALRSVAEVVTSAGVAVPPIVEDALRLSAVFGGSCDAG